MKNLNKNRINTFSSPKDYVLPKVERSESRINLGKSILQMKYPYLFKSLMDNAIEDIPEKNTDFIEENEKEQSGTVLIKKLTPPKK